MAATNLLSVSRNLTALGSSHKWGPVFVLLRLPCSTECNALELRPRGVGVGTSFLKLSNPLCDGRFVYPSSTDGQTLGLLARFGHREARCCELGCADGSGPCFTSLGYTPSSGVAGSRGTSVFSVQELLSHCPQQLHHVTFPPAVLRPVSPHAHQHCYFLVFSWQPHPRGCEVLSLCRLH